jgi:hypothetical protein
MATLMLPPSGGDDNPPIPLFLEVDASLAAVRVQPDHEFGLVELHIFQGMTNVIQN